jgi:hypothetical protein
VGNVLHAPTLVEGDPGDDRRMRSVAFDDRRPFRDQGGDSPWAELVGRGRLTPDHEPEPVGPRAVAALVAEWTAIVERDRSHPSIIAWVPLNESWGVQHIAHDARQRAFSRGISDLTRALDGSRPVISNDGWEHTASDIWTVHDYEADPEVLASRYGSIDAVLALLADVGPAGRRISVGQTDAGEPVMLTEFGGVSYADEAVDGAWGYSSATDPADFAARVTGIIGAVSSSPILSGFCYTQLTDTGQETNGLLRADRTPKTPMEDIRRVVTGESHAP